MKKATSHPDFLDIDPPEIFKTRDYDLFKLLKWNRELIHMGHLSQCISQNNKLYLHPIIVNEDMEVIDGQHRLAYAKEVGCPIYYVIDHHYKKMDLGNHNIASTVWKNSTFCDYFQKIEIGKEEFDDKCRSRYSFINKMKERYNIEVNVFLHCFARRNDSKATLRFRQGQVEFTFPEDKIEALIQDIHKILWTAKGLGVKTAWKKGWWRSVLMICLKEGFDIEHLIHKMEMNPESVVRAFRFSSEEEIKRVLIDDVYNKGIRLNRLER